MVLILLNIPILCLFFVFKCELKFSCNSVSHRVKCDQFFYRLFWYNTSDNYNKFHSTIGFLCSIFFLSSYNIYFQFRAKRKLNLNKKKKSNVKTYSYGNISFIKNYYSFEFGSVKQFFKHMSIQTSIFDALKRWICTNSSPNFVWKKYFPFL